MQDSCDILPIAVSAQIPSPRRISRTASNLLSCCIWHVASLPLSIRSAIELHARRASMPSNRTCHLDGAQHSPPHTHTPATFPRDMHYFSRRAVPGSVEEGGSGKPFLFLFPPSPVCFSPFHSNRNPPSLQRIPFRFLFFSLSSPFLISC